MRHRSVYRTSASSRSLRQQCVELGLGEKEREHLLTADTPFEEILRRLRGRDNPPRPRPKPGKAGGPDEGASRSIWTITPSDRAAVDLFLSGRNGYRAAYNKSIDCGEHANSTALKFLSAWLCDFDGVPVVESPVPLLGAGAKAWIPEDERTNCALTTGRILAREVLVPAWLQAAEARVAVRTTKGDRYEAAAGILAPHATRLNVFGAWIRDNQIVDNSVKDRGGEIHRYGYT